MLPPIFILHQAKSLPCVKGGVADDDGDGRIVPLQGAVRNVCQCHAITIPYPLPVLQVDNISYTGIKYNALR